MSTSCNRATKCVVATNPGLDEVVCCSQWAPRAPSRDGRAICVSVVWKRSPQCLSPNSYRRYGSIECCSRSQWCSACCDHAFQTFSRPQGSSLHPRTRRFEEGPGRDCRGPSLFEGVHPPFNAPIFPSNVRFRLRIPKLAGRFVALRLMILTLDVCFD